MAAPAKSTIETRAAQMFFALEPAEIERVRRFGTCRTYAAGEALANVGKVAQGLTIIISGHVDILQRLPSGGHRLIVTHGPGSFMGELAQLAGRPALIDAYAKEPVHALVIPTDKLRALLIGEAELGERIMRALILRRVGLIGRRRPRDRRPHGQRRRAAAAGLPTPQRPSIPKPRSRDR